MTTSIASTFKNQTFFLTGASGLVGSAFLRKLFVSCGSFKKVYILLREKKGVSVEDRLDKFLSTFMFESLEMAKEELKSKIGIIKGDCELPNLGIGNKDWDLLIKEVNYVVHISATIKLDEELSRSTKINVKAVDNILTLASQMIKLKGFIYVSTAYSNCNRVSSTILEQFYEPPMLPDDLYELVENIEKPISEEALKKILKSWPNTYTFTKAVAEYVVRTKGKNLPVAVVRPAIVFPAINEPIPGYCDKLQGFTGISAAIYVGLFGCMPFKREYPVAIVPVDYTVNYMLVILSEITSHRKPTAESVYNYTDSLAEGLTWDKLLNSLLKCSHQYPSMYAIRKPFLLTSTNETIQTIAQFFLHSVPWFTINLLLRCSGSKSNFTKVQQSLIGGMKQLTFFTTNYWLFEMTNYKILWKKLSQQDKETFPFHHELVDLKKSNATAAMCVRKYIFMESDDTLKMAKFKLQILEILYYLIIFGLIYYVYCFLK